MVLSSDGKRVVECNVLEVVSPQEKRVLCCGSSEEVVSRGLDGYPQVMLSGETNAALLSSDKIFQIKQYPR